MGIISSLCESGNNYEDTAIAGRESTYKIEKSVLDSLKKTPNPTPSGKTSSIDDFRVIRVLGKGSYGKVYLVQHKRKQKYYAMKCIRKGNVLLKNLLNRVLSEKDILKELKHPFVVRLKCAFQNKTKVYLAMDFCQGGDLNTQLHQKRKFDENAVRFYASEIILALQYIHENLNVIHRDIKPENIMFCADGHIKLTDFGLAKITQKTFSLCGTPEYVAPEIIMGEGYGKEVDWWGLGCIMYELLAGASPFLLKNREQMPLNILTKDPTFPDYFSETMKDILLKLLAKEPKQRLGTNGAEEVKKHPFFKDVDWKKALEKKQVPPFIPTLNGKEDTRYFMDVPNSKSTAQTAETTIGGPDLKITPQGETDFPAFSYVDNESVLAHTRNNSRNPSEIGEFLYKVQTRKQSEVGENMHKIHTRNHSEIGEFLHKVHTRTQSEIGENLHKIHIRSQSEIGERLHEKTKNIEAIVDKVDEIENA